MYFLYKHEYGTLNPVKVILRREMGQENNGEDDPNQCTTYEYMETSNKIPEIPPYTNRKKFFKSK
jgi:hypothetical protein